MSNLSFVWTWLLKAMAYGNNSALRLIFFFRFHSGCGFMMPEKLFIFKQTSYKHLILGYKIWWGNTENMQGILISERGPQNSILNCFKSESPKQNFFHYLYTFLPVYSVTGKKYRFNLHRVKCLIHQICAIYFAMLVIFFL